ncbi:complex I subunit 4 family protein [Natronomonas marina]|jgi:NADH-quinone oxidoreductase subunit M|uniref:complex I subunit 4 family protein n=1 Tax=Natronomonas marina TaxID=2961939 RepID=UPI0020C9FECD|nr:NuoM family protein [Natronomonas marina]
MLIEALIAVCLLGAGAVMVAPDRYAGKLAFGISALPVVGSLYMYFGFDGSGNALLGGDIAYETFFEWLSVGPYTVNYHMGLDGISLPLVVLSTVLTMLAILSAWTPIDERQSQFYGLMLFMEAALIGVFAALDFLLWFVFWEAVLVPMYFLIGVWGGPRRKYAAIKFFVYTNIASLVMFIGFFALVFGLGDAVSSTGLPEIAQALRAGQLSALGPVPASTLALAAFVAMFVGFAVKVPAVPFHTWLPDAHVEAPTPASVMLAGVLLKMGTYALLRFNFTMLPEQAATLAVPIAALAVVSIIYGALLALAQSDLKRIVAYSSVSSMGYVILGLIAYTVYGVGGATFQMVAHGLISGLLFMTVGVFYNATHTRMVGDMSGMADRMPVTAGVFVAGAFAYMGLPLMAGFAAELFIFIGAFQSTVIPAAPLFTALAMFGIVIVAGYLLWAMQRSLFGPFRLETDYEITRAPVHDVVPIVTLVLLIVLLGTVPELFWGMIQDASAAVIDVGGDL